MSEYSCGACGTPLHHVDEPCPNCLPSMAERPPTTIQSKCSNCKSLEELAIKLGNEKAALLAACKKAIDKIRNGEGNDDLRAAEILESAIKAEKDK